jgi:hypothetical protein
MTIRCFEAWCLISSGVDVLGGMVSFAEEFQHLPRERHVGNRLPFSGAPPSRRLAMPCSEETLRRHSFSLVQLLPFRVPMHGPPIIFF